jgi:hypothetical protein
VEEPSTSLVNRAKAGTRRSRLGSLPGAGAQPAARSRPRRSGLERSRTENAETRGARSATGALATTDTLPRATSLTQDSAANAVPMGLFPETPRNCPRGPSRAAFASPATWTRGKSPRFGPTNWAYDALRSRFGCDTLPHSFAGAPNQERRGSAEDAG